jgi:hypothetical protein
MTTNLADLTNGQLKRIIAIREQIQALHGQIESIAAGGGGGEVPTPPPVKPYSRQAEISHDRRPQT